MRYDIQGGNLPVVICYLESGESMTTESGGMSWMSPNMQMQTSTNGGIGKMFGRMVSGEKAFQNNYICEGGNGMIAFASSFPGSIQAFEIGPGQEIVLQKHAFLAAQSSVNMSVFFNNNLGGGLFGGEGFIMNLLSGNGVAFAEFDGHVVQYNLAAGQTLLVDTGHVAAMDKTVTLDIQRVKGAKNMLLGGEGLFNTRVTGPGRVWLQSMPIPNLASAINPYIVTGNK